MLKMTWSQSAEGRFLALQRSWKVLDEKQVADLSGRVRLARVIPSILLASGEGSLR